MSGPQDSCPPDDPVQSSPPGIEVEIVYARAQGALVKHASLPVGATVQEALELAADDASFRGVEVLHAAVGIFGRVVPKDLELNDGDRIEIYRPLAVDPKIARRQRAK